MSFPIYLDNRRLAWDLVVSILLAAAMVGMGFVRLRNAIYLPTIFLASLLSFLSGVEAFLEGRPILLRQDWPKGWSSA